jgi:hypothetical protein
MKDCVGDDPVALPAVVDVVGMLGDVPAGGPQHIDEAQRGLRRAFREVVVEDLIDISGRASARNDGLRRQSAPHLRTRARKRSK